MNRSMKEFVAEMIYEPPKCAKPMVLTYQRVLDQYELRHLTMGSGVDCIRHIKWEMAHKLADHIFKECQVLQIPGVSELMAGYPIRMELTINDRGSYENFAPIAKRDGQREGFEKGKRAVVRTIPYGFEPEQYYE